MSEHEQLRIGEHEPSEPTQATITASAVDAAEPAPPPPTPEQAAAIATRDRNVFLVAGAGTGKTRVLVQRYCDAVTEDGLGIERILAFTFTEKAAGELRARVRAELARRARGEDDAERSRELWRLARDTERAWIGTIHGFCRRLLATHPVAAGLDPRFRVLAEGETELVAERAFDAALDEIATGPQSGEAEAVAAGFAVWRLRKLIVGAHEQLRGQGAEAPQLPPMPEPRLAPSNGKRAKAKGSGDTGDEDPELSPAEAAYVAESYNSLRELLGAYGRHFERLKAERSGLDFEDLQIRAVRLLRDRPEIAARYRDRFAHLMVDEFQDTNRLQLALMRELSGPETRVFVVGDEFQSIYGFRNADLEVFRSERRRAAAAPDARVTVMPLRGNFRSRPQIIATVNALGGVLLDGFEPLAAGRESEDAAGPEVELLLTESDGWDDDAIDLEQLPGEDTPPHKVAEARRLATRLRELADDGAERSGMVLLLRAFTHVATYEEALERAGLAPYVVGGRGYWSHQQVEDMLRLLGCVANPLEDEVLFGALASPAVGVSPDALWMLRRAATREGRSRHVWPLLRRRFGRDASSEEEEDAPRVDRDEDEAWADRIDPTDAERLREFCRRLDRLRAAAPLLSLEALTDRTARELGYDLAVLMRDRGTRRFANVRKLMRFARQFESAEGRDLGAFLRYAEARTSRGQREGLAATEAEDHDGVRIMTIHAAKGLEFETVAVADLARPLLSGGGWVDLRLGAPAEANGETSAEQPAEPDTEAPSLGLVLARAGEGPLTLWDFQRLKEESAEADAAEELRLTYVAVTRARERLLLSSTFDAKDLEGSDTLSRSVVRRLLPEGGFDGSGAEIELDGVTIPVRINRAGPDSAAELVRRERTATPEPAIAAGRRPPLLPEVHDAPAAGHLSYAALADFERCGYRFYAERVLGLRSLDPGSEDPVPPEPDEQPSDAEVATELEAHGGGLPVRERRLAFGNAVHGLLEWSARNRWARPGAELCSSLLRGENLDAGSDEVERALGLVGGWLDSELCASISSSRARLRPEAPFLLGVGASVVRGKMDLVAQLSGGEVVVVDFKTDALGDADPESHARRYETQRDLYALAASRLAGDGADIRTAYAFLEAPERPVERRYDAAALAAAQARVESLIANVAAARFEVTDAPHLALCHDCPARKRLCIHPDEMTLRRLDA